MLEQKNIDSLLSNKVELGTENVIDSFSIIKVFFKLTYSTLIFVLKILIPVHIINSLIHYVYLPHKCNCYNIVHNTVEHEKRKETRHYILV